MLCATTPNNFNIQRFSIAVADLDQHFSRVNQLSMMKQHELFPCSRNFPFELNKMTPNSTLCRKRAHTHTHQWAWQWFSKARNFLIFNESQIKFKLNTLGQFPQIENAIALMLARTTRALVHSSLLDKSTLFQSILAFQSFNYKCCIVDCFACTSCALSIIVVYYKRNSGYHHEFMVNAAHCANSVANFKQARNPNPRFGEWINWFFSKLPDSNWKWSKPSTDAAEAELLRFIQNWCSTMASLASIWFFESIFKS